MMKELGVINTKFEDCYSEYKGHVMVTFIQSCQDGDGQRAVWEIGGKKTDIVISADPQVPQPGMPVPGKYVLEDITEWREKVVFPDLDAIDWEKQADKDIHGDAIAVLSGEGYKPLKNGKYTMMETD